MKFFTKRMRSQKGFTLIELIIVIAIIGILAAILLPRFTDFTGNAEAAAFKSVAQNLATLYETARAEGRTLPVAAAGVSSGVSVGSSTFNFDTTKFTLNFTATGFELQHNTLASNNEWTYTSATGALALGNK